MMFGGFQGWSLLKGGLSVGADLVVYPTRLFDLSCHTMSASLACPCDPARHYAQCCGPIHQGRDAKSAEQLMRSRYSAYALNLNEYLLNSWHPSSRPSSLSDDEAGSTRWLGLKIKRHEENGNNALVEFIARYRVGGTPAVRMHETSRFVRLAGRWYYLDGELHSPPPPR